MLIIGLTGGIGSGKTAVCSIFSELGVPVIDADIVARQVVEPGQAALKLIQMTFGDGVITASDQLDRARLRTIIFSDPTKRKKLEAILHPAIQTEMLRQAKALNHPYCVFAIPLLIEAKQTDMVDRILVIDAPDELRRQRIKARDQLNDHEIDAIFSAQLTREARLSQADDTIYNHADLNQLRSQVIDLNSRYIELAQQKKDQ